MWGDRKESRMDILERAIAAAQSGDRDLAARLAAEVLKSDPRNAQAWLLMSGLRDSLDEQIECAKRALAIEPDNKQARLRLAQVQAAQEAKQRILAEASHETATPSPDSSAKEPAQSGSSTLPLRHIGPFVMEKAPADSDISAAEDIIDIETAEVPPTREIAVEKHLEAAPEQIAQAAHAIPTAEKVAEKPIPAAEEAVKARRRVNFPLVSGIALLAVTLLCFLCYWLITAYQSGAFTPYEYAPPQEQVPGSSAQVGTLLWQVNYWQDLGTDLPGEERVQGRGSIRTRGRFILVSLRLDNNTIAFSSFNPPLLVYGDGKELKPTNRTQAWVPEEMRLSQTAGRIAPGTSATIRIIYELPPGVTYPEGILVNDLTGAVIGQAGEALIPYPHTGEE
jgi:tetratricopeptide (TPR) repeat protein